MISSMPNAREWAAETTREVMGRRKRARGMPEADIRFLLQHAFEAGQRAVTKELRAAIEDELDWLGKVVTESEGDTHVRNGARTRMRSLAGTLQRTSVPA